jgi:hypothetical protein
MQELKILVVVMGVLIAASMGLLGWGFYSKVKDRVVAPEQAAAPVGKGGARGEFGVVNVELPSGCTIVEMRPHGDRLYLRTGPVGLCERVLLLDAASGRLLGTILLRP